MTTAIKTLRIATVLAACAVSLGLAAGARAATHPDGASTTYRGWGPTALSADGYACTLFDSSGVQVGSVAFHGDGRIDLTLGTEQAHFQAAPIGLTDVHELDPASFPDLPARFKDKQGYRLLTFTGRFAVGVNMDAVEPVTQLAKNISVVEARCVYVIDDAGNVVFCLNCLFAVS
jgi:hypothetical protein